MTEDDAHVTTKDSRIRTPGDTASIHSRGEGQQARHPRAALREGVRHHRHGRQCIGRATFGRLELRRKLAGEVPDLAYTRRHESKSQHRRRPPSRSSPIAQPTPPGAPICVSGQSEGPAFPRDEDHLLARFRLTPADASGESDHPHTTTRATATPRTQPSCRGRPDHCMARMMRKSNRVSSTSDAALLLLTDI
jgi:hypothetical protein